MGQVLCTDVDVRGGDQRVMSTASLRCLFPGTLAGDAGGWYMNLSSEHLDALRLSRKVAIGALTSTEIFILKIMMTHRKVQVAKRHRVMFRTSTSIPSSIWSEAWRVV